MIRQKPILLSIFLFMIVNMISCQKQSQELSALPPGSLLPLKTISMTINSIETEIEVALTFQEQQQGLMYRRSMLENHGMIFVYTEPMYMSFWMKNTYIPLSIAYIRADGIISNIEKMKPQSGTMTPSEHYKSKYKCIYALEMNQGWFEKNGVKSGDKIEIPTGLISQLR